MALRLAERKLDQLFSLSIGEQMRSYAALGLVVLGPLLALATFLALQPLDQISTPFGLRAVLLADLIYVLVTATLIFRRIAGMIAARQAHSAGSRLHLRLTGAFALFALIPTVLVAIFAGLVINIGLEGWFSDRVRSAIGSSLEAAQAYQDEHRQDLTDDTIRLALSVQHERSLIRLDDAGVIRRSLEISQRDIQRGMRTAFVLDDAGEIWARGESSYYFDFEPVSTEQLNRAENAGILLIEDWALNELRAIFPLQGFNEPRYLYVSREVDGELFALLDETEATSVLYRQLENERGRRLFEFSLVYLGFALILILAAIWLGLYIAERLSRPVGRLAGAAQAVGAGDLSVQVPEEEGDDEIAMLGRYFNRMTKQLSAQRETLLSNNRQIDERRRLFDSVLSSVTSGVLGLDASGNISFQNKAASIMLAMPAEIQAQHPHLQEAVPEFIPLFEKLHSGTSSSVQSEIKLLREGLSETLLVRIAERHGEKDRLEGYVIAFDDVTELVAAQRVAAWGDVARRIAHEIKNPLTPIRLSAERIRRKYQPEDPEDAQKLGKLTEVIVRQTEDLRRIVDEFSRFARMPSPRCKPVDLIQLIHDAITLQEEALSGINVELDLPERQVQAELDSGMIGQALTNLIKNASEAIETRINEKENNESGTIRLSLSKEINSLVLRIEDNGIGLPQDRSHLFEPYVTTREKGTGLGLPIVKKIINEHGGTLELKDAAQFGESELRGAAAIITFPTPSSSHATGIIARDSTDGKSGQLKRG